ncbi:MAG: lysylphosphatidylglycerol synthase domain-containing protein, partial [Ignavibacteriales bacterium]|nr:lysylphosphatidylglycerol synthase domain-containing protein [Ignavibacteriales bacterium]
MRIRSTMIFISKFLVSVALLTGLIWYIDFSAVLQSLRQASFFPLAAGSLLVIANVGLQYYRWRYLLRLSTHDVIDKDILSSLLIGFSAGFFTPAQVGEFGGRLATLRSVRGAHIIGLSIIDRLSLLGVTIVTGCLSIAFFFSTYRPAYWNGYYTIFAVVVALLFLLLLLYPGAAKLLLGLLPRRIREHRFYSVIEIFESTFHAAQAWRLFVLSTAFMGVVILQYHLFITAFSPADITASVACVPSILFVKSLFLP